MDDLFDDAAQPKCPECGTVLSDVDGGYECKTCGLLYLRNQV
jgi:tRNA(Ile2) C34 agmatinyltransferase TiaS